MISQSRYVLRSEGIRLRRTMPAPARVQVRPHLVPPPALHHCHQPHPHLQLQQLQQTIHHAWPLLSHDRKQRPRSVAQRALISYVEVTSGSDLPEDLAVEVHPTEGAVGNRVCELVVQAAQAAVVDRGVFFLAIPGGSVLKMCGGLVGRPMPWDKTFLFYVNHKCVPHTDSSSTHRKALDLFLTRVGAPLGQVAAPQGTGDAFTEAVSYESQLRQVAVQRGMPLSPDLVPRFDLMLLGMGADGHVGSLYPGSAETATAGPGAPLVLPVARKSPPSITLSLPVMCAARQVVVAATGGSKAEAVRGALQGSGEGGRTALPARLVRPAAGGSAVWVMDAPAAARLEVAAGARALLTADELARAQ